MDFHHIRLRLIFSQSLAIHGNIHAASTSGVPSSSYTGTQGTVLVGIASSLRIAQKWHFTFIFALDSRQLGQPRKMVFSSVAMTRNGILVAGDGSYQKPKADF